MQPPLNGDHLFVEMLKVWKGRKKRAFRVNKWIYDVLISILRLNYFIKFLVYLLFFLCSYAVVCVEIKNEGEDAFKPEIYGDTIILERRITESTSTTVLKDHQGFNFWLRLCILCYVILPLFFFFSVNRKFISHNICLIGWKLLFIS